MTYHNTKKAIRATEPTVIALFQEIDRQNISLRSVAEKAGVDERVLSNWRCGRFLPRLDLFLAVCNTIGFQLELLPCKPKSQAKKSISTEITYSL